MTTSSQQPRATSHIALRLHGSRRLARYRSDKYYAPMLGVMMLLLWLSGELALLFCWVLWCHLRTVALILVRVKPGLEPTNFED